MKKKLLLNKETMSVLNMTEMSKVVGQAAGECPAIDPIDHTVLLPNPADCASFFSCSQGVAILMHCPDGMHFNDNLDTCDWPENAKCNGFTGGCTDGCGLLATLWNCTKGNCTHDCLTLMECLPTITE